MSIQTIVVGTDFSDSGRLALDWAIDLARGLGAQILVAHAFDVPVYGLPDAALLVDAKTAADLTTRAQVALDKEVGRVQGRGVPVAGKLVQGDPREEVPSLATRSGAGLVVVGSHGRRGVTRALLGSVSEGMVRTSNVPVVVVRRPASRPQAARD